MLYIFILNKINDANLIRLSINKKKKSTDRYHLSVDFVKYFKKMDVYSKKEKCTFPYFLCCTKFGCSSKEMLEGCSKTKFPPSSNH